MMKSKSNPNYALLRDSQLGWLHIGYQWFVVTGLKIYFSFRYQLIVTGKENIPKSWQPMVVAANHLSSLDPLLVSVAMHFRPVSYLAKKELFENFWMRLYNIAMASISVNRQKLELSTIKSTHKVFQHGKWALGIFPEGQRNQNENNKTNAKKGVAYFARSGKVPVLPIGLSYTPAKGRKKIFICIGETIPYEQDIETLTETIQSRIQELVEQAKRLNE